MMLTLLDAAACLVTLASIGLIYELEQRKYLPRVYPPGPKGWPIFGNLFDLPNKDHWPQYAAWSREIGSQIISLNMMGGRIVVLNDSSTIEDLFVKRGAIYSERPRMPMLNEAAGFDWDWGFTEDSEKWKVSRREFNLHFRQITSRRYRPQEVIMANKLLFKLLVSPERFMEHFRYMAGSFMLAIGYGLDVKLENDELIDLSEIGSQGLEASGDKNIINLMPWTQHIPSCLSWLPGMKWKSEADAFKQWGFEMRDVPFAHVKAQLEMGIASPSITTELLDRLQDKWPDPHIRENMVKGIVGATYIAGSDTTLSALRFFILAMVLFPDVQRRAQEELDKVVGPDRLPLFSDEASLPYITAICKELLRWTSPAAVPHSNSRDDIYQGYYIPKGSIVLGNTWAILHDPMVYPDPEKFHPDRFLTADGKLNPNAPDISAAFGYGRRVCPGRFLALDSLWIATACILAVFCIDKAIGPDGKEITPPVDINSGLINHPKPFKCDIKPRSKQMVSLIRASVVENH